MSSDYDADKVRAPRDWVPEELSADELFAADQEAAKTGGSEQNNGKLTVTGLNVNDTRIESWENSPLHKDIVDVLINRCHFTVPRPVQAATVPQVLNGRDVIGHTNTGGGKTLAFVLPILDMLLRIPEEERSVRYDPFAVVIAPARELAIQIHQNFFKFGEVLGFKSVLCIGELSRALNGQKLARDGHIACGTPGRIMDLIEKGEISCNKLKFLVIDEADSMLASKESEHLNAILRHRGMIANKPNRQTLMFSATLPDVFTKLSLSLLKENHVVVSNGNCSKAAELVQQEYIETRGKAGKYTALMEIFAKDAADGDVAKKTLIFVQTKKSSDFLALELSQDGFVAEGLNGDRPQNLRTQMMERFKKGEFSVLVGTDVCSRGLDIPVLDRVINYDVPECKVGSTQQAVDTFIHRIGRTGRSRIGIAYTFLDPNNDSDVTLSKELIKVCRDVGQTPPDFMVEMSELANSEGFGFSSGGGGGSSGFGNDGGFGGSSNGFGSSGFGESAGGGGSGFGGGGFGESNGAPTSFGSTGFGFGNDGESKKPDGGSSGFGGSGFGGAPSNEQPKEQSFGSTGFGTAASDGGSDDTTKDATSDKQEPDDGGGEW